LSENIVIHAHHLTVRYGSRLALSDISLKVSRGEFLLVSGPSGCGKSTLALCLVGLIPQAVPAHLSGQVMVNRLDTQVHPLSVLARQAGIVFQNPATQLFNATVEEEVAFAPRNLNLPGEEIEARVRRSLASSGIEHLRRRSVRALSGGEQQRVAIAAVLALRPPVLILDEPTANLDWHGVEQITSTLARLHQEQGLTVIVIEHRLAAMAHLATRAVLMDGGRIVADGSPTAVLTDEAQLATLGLRYPRLDVGRRVEAGDLDRPATSGEPMVTLRQVTAGYDEPVLSGLDLALYPGQFAALVGDNGAGKSTIARLLAGILRPQRGRVEWHPALRRLPPGRRVGLLFQNPLHQLVCDRVEDEVAFGPTNYKLNDDLSPLLAAADLMALRHRRLQALSAGQQQRTALAATLALRPRLLILDEPTMGQDWAHLSRLMDYLTHLHHDGQSILLITHDDRLVCRYAQRIMRLADGRVVADGALPASAAPLPRSEVSIPIAFQEVKQ
jgi:energy-coupling factor transporter ATP-binding protein EcfA2